MVVAFCGDEYNKGDLYSEEVERQFNQYVKPILGDKAILFSWNASHSKIHEDCMLQILQSGSFQNQSTGSQKTGATESAEAFTSGTKERSQMRHSPAIDQGSWYNSKGDSQGTTRTPVSAHDHLTDKWFHRMGGWQSHQISGNAHHQDRGERRDGARSKQHDTRNQAGRGQSQQTPAEYNVQNNWWQWGNGAMYQQRDTSQQPVQYSTPPGYSYQGNIPQSRGTGQTVTVLKTRLRYGQISFEKKDLEIMEEGLEVPVWLVEHLQTTKRNVKVALLEILRDAIGNLNPVVTEGVSTFEKINTPERAHYHPLSETTNQSSHQIPGNVYHQDRGERGDGARSKQHDTRYPPGPGQSHQTPAEYNVQNNRGQRGNGAMYQQRHTRQQPVQYSTPPGYSYQGNIPQSRGTGQTVTVLKTRLRYGQISFEKKDLEIMEEGLEVPVWLVEHLQTTKRNVKVALLEIHRDASGNLNPTVTEDMLWFKKAKSIAEI